MFYRFFSLFLSVKIARKYRREPKSVMEFRDAFRDQREALAPKNPLCIDFPPDSQFMGRKSFEAEEFVKRINRVLQENDSSNIHFLMPMVGQHATCEFLKGVLKVLSPDVKIPVTSLKGPARFRLNRFDDGVDDEPEVDADNYFRECVDASLEKHGTRRDKTHFVVIDFVGEGTTKRAFDRHLGEGYEFISQNEFSFAKIDEYHMTKDKTQDGRVNIARGEMLEMILDQDPNSPPQTRFGPDDFLHDGRYLLGSLEHNASRYLRLDEISQINWRTAFEKPRGSYRSKKWPPVIDFIRDVLPEERQREIVMRLKRDDFMQARMAYQYGIAVAKDFLRSAH